MNVPFAVSLVRTTTQAATDSTTTTKDPTTTSRSSGVPKLSLKHLLGDLKNEDLSGLLPPGFNPDKIPEEKERTTSTKSISTTTSGESGKLNLGCVNCKLRCPTFQ